MQTNRNRFGPHYLQVLFHVGSHTGVTDGQLLERFVLRDGDASESAFAALVERHGPLVWRTCRAVLRDEHDAADAFQAAFLVLARKAGSLWVRDSIGPWLHRVARRAAIHARRGKNRRHEAEKRAAKLAAEWAERDMPDDTAELIHEAIDQLPERHRLVIFLCDIEERSHEEACAAPSVSRRYGKEPARPGPRAAASLAQAPGSGAGGDPGGDQNLGGVARRSATRSGDCHEPKRLVIFHRSDQSER